MSHVLVTGGAGFIGANFVHHCLRGQRYDRVVVLDALTYAGNLDNLASVAQHPRVRFVRGDICDTELVAALMAEEAVECVIHFAAESHVDRSIDGPDEFIRTNVIGTHSLLKAARRVWSREGKIRADVRFHHVSTDEVYGSLADHDPAFTERTPYSPNSPYSASKAASDHIVRAYHHTFGLPITTTNCSNNYGPYQFPEKLIPLMLVNALEGRPLPVYGEGQNVRDWLHVEDHCRAIDLVLRSGRVGETYNVGGRSERKNIDVVHRLCEILDTKFAREPELASRFPKCPAAAGRRIDELIAYVPDRLGHDFRYAIDDSKIQKELGFALDRTFEAGLDQTIDWYLRNAGWWKTVLNGSYKSNVEQKMNCRLSVSDPGA